MGEKAEEIIKENPCLEILGVAGSTYKSANLSLWCPPDDFEKRSLRMNIKQSYKFTEKQEEYHYHNPLNETLSRVVCVDGIWFCTPKEIALNYKYCFLCSTFS